VVAILLAFSAIVWRLVDLQVIQHDELVARGVDQRVRRVPLAAERGVIFDRNGTPLAVAVPQNTIWANPQEIVDPAAAAAALEPVLGIPAADLLSRLAQGDKQFVYLSRQRDDSVAQHVRQLDIDGVGIVPESKRFYPQGELAASLIGLTDIDNRGIAGLEVEYEDALTGTPGELVVEQDPDGREIPQGEREYVPPQRGDDLVLTIDRALQYKVEQELLRQVRDTQAKAASMVVMDVVTGDVLAMATILGPAEQAVGGTVAPDATPRVATPSERNRSITDAYEPGSVMKVVPIAAALEEGIVTPEELISVPYSRTYYGHRGLESEQFTFEEHDYHEEVSWRLADIVRVSSNIGTINVAERLGQDGLHEYQRAFGFGTPTGVDFPGEGAGTVKPLDEWSETTLPTSAIGQGIATTEVQMLGVYATIANCGVWRQPRLVGQTIDAEGDTHDRPAGDTRRVVSPRTAALLNEMLVGVTANDDGTGANARVKGYTVAGKTGTALKVLPDGTYGRTEEEHRYRSSFVGFLPAEQPRLAAMVMIDEPHWEARYASVAAAPVFSRVMSYAVQGMRVVPPEAGTRACNGAADTGLPAALPTAGPTEGATATDTPGPEPVPEVIPPPPSTLVATEPTPTEATPTHVTAPQPTAPEVPSTEATASPPTATDVPSTEATAPPPTAPDVTATHATAPATAVPDVATTQAPTASPSP
jgi:cell division protein FtsI (penicillin-binding protein 3)